MDFNRNQLFLVGLLLLLFGLQFRLVETFTLNQPTTRFLHPLDGGAPSAAAQAASATNAEPRLPASGRRKVPKSLTKSC